jgi:hypothetical protein
MISVPIAKIQQILERNKTEVNRIVNQKLIDLQSFITTPNIPGKKRGDAPIPISLSLEQMNYLRFLELNFKQIVFAKPNEIISFKQTFDTHIDGASMRNYNKVFKNELLRRLGYVELRKEHYPDHFKSTGIKACVYCNSQLAITAQTKGNKRYAKFQVDHFLPKAEYPCFSISYFNLFPSCSSCNGRKSAKTVEFALYSEDPEQLRNSTFKFRLEPKSLSKYKLSGNPDDFEITFRGSGYKDYNDAFDILGIYETQKDLVEELVMKSIIYDQTYLQQLKTSFSKLYPRKAPMASRFFVGNYTKDRDIHKRPLSKFTMDIAKQLKLIGRHYPKFCVNRPKRV